MGRRIYDKTTRELLKDMLKDFNLQPGVVFTGERAVAWFAQNYPKLKAGSIKAHLVQASTNDPSRLHHPSTNSTDDLLFRVASQEFRLYVPGQDPAPIQELIAGDTARQMEHHQDCGDEEFEADPATDPGSSEFLLERDLQRYLAENLSIIEPGLSLYVDEDGLRGLEYDAGGRRIDILAVDRNGGFVVCELKVSKGYDRVIGQTLRYMNWVTRELAEPNQSVRGFIICRNISEDLKLAACSIPNIQLYEYELKVAVTRVEPLAL
ncbi:hypothetical protein SAMN05216271_0438 [Halopseudomonas sabulinigri]|uniref:DUF91 domain-containing protein n=1 Tax=Halopseudomonas sabulinigri TaxID=472181 RepID=A0A1H1M0U6_9GAMM|nr:endonuclease NucS domain-containing protein [Halopseudomonas sabulinigri]SDR80317.1 hypothetical protein SAMN05216271_0438 [Halopseudomonas sabulinigri]